MDLMLVNLMRIVVLLELTHSDELVVVNLNEIALLFEG